jgi:hypothetical protein
MNPNLAQTRLMAQTDNWINLPTNNGIDWHNSPRAFANTGNRKGAAQNPPVQYIGGPQVAAASVTSPATPSITPAQGCQSPDHHSPLKSFTLNQGVSALVKFIGECQGIELRPNGPIGCILYYNPCSKKNGGKAVDVTMTVWQSVWNTGDTSTFPNVQEMNDTVNWIMNSCDTTTTSAKWGGYKSVEVSTGMRMYNISANQDGQYPTPPGFHTVQVTTEFGGENCPAWDSS